MPDLEADSSGFPCPHCNSMWWVRDWFTEYNHPMLGSSEVRCPECHKIFCINVQLSITSSK
jgi:DNA-directed RNA polymerase subunit RPC12/RpoP